MSSTLDLEETFTIDLNGEVLLGIHHAIHPSEMPDCVAINVVGGPQYRVGSHRQFVLLARACAAQHIPFIRFDYRGMGDSGGARHTFENVEQDIHAIVTWVRARYPHSKVVLVGLCDGASAIAMYCRQHSVDGVILINPWVHSEQLQAVSMLKHYYARRLFSAEFWRNALRFNFNFRASLREVGNSLGGLASNGAAESDFVNRMHDGLTRSAAPVLLMMSGEDLTAREFDELLNANVRWQPLSARERWSRVDLPGADHTFSDRGILDTANSTIVEWLKTEVH